MRNVQTSKHPNVQIGVFAPIVAAFVAGSVCAQSLDELLDDETFLRGLSEYQLPELIEHYFEQHPPEDEAAALEQQLALDRMLLRDSEQSMVERERLIERMLDRRARAIDATDDVQRRAMLLVEQASDLYFEYLALDASVMVTLFGMPSDSQRRRVSEGAERLYRTALRAEAAVDEALLDLESQPDFARDPALRERRREMATRERDRRVPFLLGIGAILHTTLNAAGGEREKLLREASRVLEPLPGRLDGMLAAQVRLYQAVIAHRRGELDTARERFRSVRDDPAADPLSDFAAQLGEVIVLREENALGSAVRAIERIADERGPGDQMFFRLMLADQTYLVHQAEIAAEMREASDAFEAYLALLEATPVGEQDHARRAVFERLRQLDHDEADVDALPPLVRIALHDRAGGHPGRRNEAIAAVRSIIDEETLVDREYELALIVLARLLQRAGETVEAGQRWVELAERFPYSAEAERAIERGVALLAEAYRNQPSQAAAPLRDGLDLLLEQFSDLARVNHWRFLAGRLALRESRYDAAEQHFAAINQDAPQWADAQFMRIETMRGRAMMADSDDERSARYAALLDAIPGPQQTVRDMADRESDSQHGASLQRSVMLMSLYEAEATLMLDEPERALEMLQAFDRDAFEGDASLTAHWLQLRVGALEELDRREEAREVLVQFIDAAPERAASVLSPMMRSLAQRVDRFLAEHRPEEAQRLAERDMVPLAQVIERWLDDYGEADAPWSLRVDVADAYRYAARFETALDIYERLQNEQPNAVSVLTGRAECLYHLADDGNDARLAEAMQLYRRIVSGGERLGHDVYWLAQLRTLQILERVNRNTHQIAPQIQRLRQQHPDLGGDRYRREFDRLQREHS